MDITPFTIAIITIAFFLAGTVKGVLGLGLPTISIGLLSLVMSPAQAATLLIIPATITNIQQSAPSVSCPDCCLGYGRSCCSSLSARSLPEA